MSTFFRSLCISTEKCVCIKLAEGCVDSRVSNVPLTKFDLTLLSQTQQTAAAAA